MALNVIDEWFLEVLGIGFRLPSLAIRYSRSYGINATVH